MTMTVKCKDCGMVNEFKPLKENKAVHKWNCIMVKEAEQTGKYIDYNVENGTAEFRY